MSGFKQRLKAMKFLVLLRFVFKMDPSGVWEGPNGKKLYVDVTYDGFKFVDPYKVFVLHFYDYEIEMLASPMSKYLVLSHQIVNNLFP